MYLHIIKKDLKRKKTMNFILFLFITLAAMFISSSVNNIVAISTALDDYFDLAGLRDFFVATKVMGTSEDSLENILDRQDCIESYVIEPILYLGSNQVVSPENKIESLSDTIILLSMENAQMNFFGETNIPLKEVEKGKVYITRSVMEKDDLFPGDILTVTIGETSLELEIAGGFKDAFMGSNMISMSRLLINQSDYDILTADSAAEAFKGNIGYITARDTKNLEQELNKTDNNIIFMADRAMLKMTYFIYLVIAGCLLMLSVCLILIALILLRFTISFTLSEEYREIGVMKAIGIRPVKIKGLYLIKYFALSIIGAAAGFFAGIPFGNMMLKNVSGAIVMKGTAHYLINVLCVLTVPVIIMLFCFACTGKINELTPVNAIRNGSEGQRYRRKGFLRLCKSRLSPAGFMAVNDILSGFKQYCIMLLSFTLSLTLIIMIVNVINTLKSEKTLKILCMSISDAYLQCFSTNDMDFLTEGGRDKERIKLKELEETLAKYDIPAHCAMETCLKLTVTRKDASYKFLVFQGTGTTTDQYSYTEGTPPRDAGEIALSILAAKKLDARIGDTVTISYKEGDKQYMVTALFQSMNDMGNGIRLHETDKIDYSQAMSFMAHQIFFTDAPDQAETMRRIERIRDIFPDYNVYTAGEYADHLTGGAASSFDGVRLIILTVVSAICIFVVILMERSFIAREQGEIAILKTIGFKNRTIIWHHTLRAGIVLVLSTIIAVCLGTPVTKLIAGEVFKMLGVVAGMDFEIHPIEVYIIYPLVILIFVLAAAFLTAQCTRRISPSECANME